MPRIDQGDAATVEITHIARSQRGSARVHDAGDHQVRLVDGTALRALRRCNRSVRIGDGTIVNKYIPCELLLKQPGQALQQIASVPPLGHAVQTEQQSPRVIAGVKSPSPGKLPTQAITFGSAVGLDSFEMTLVPSMSIKGSPAAHAWARAREAPARCRHTAPPSHGCCPTATAR